MNEFEKVTETVAKDIGKVVAYPFVHTAQFVTVLGTALTEEPNVKAALVSLIQNGESVIHNLEAVAKAKGSNEGADLATGADTVDFFNYFKDTFLPVVEKAYKDIAASKNVPASTTQS